MAEAVGLQRQLLSAQNADGGWGYSGGCSWTEPTAFALLALESHGAENQAYERGFLWLQRSQRADGGWAPNPSVDVSTWVTSLCLLALSGRALSGRRQNDAIQWLLGQISTGPDPIERFIFRLRGVSRGRQTGGSPWFPGTAAWIAPTVISVLALSQAARQQNRSELCGHVREAQKYILYHRCRDEGWNHGGNPYLSETAVSYPEMTGMALLALYGVPSSELDLPLKLAQVRLASPGSMEAFCWLHLALVRHGRHTGDLQTGLPCRTTRDISLRLLSLAAESRSNRFVTAIG
jgi:hypothetical protein